MNNEFFDALALLEKEKGIPADYLLERIKAAIVIAVKKDYGAQDNVKVEIDDATRKFKVCITKTVVEEVTNPGTEIVLEQALKHSKRAKLGNPVDIKLETKQFGRIAAQTAKQVIRQGIREGEREHLIAKYQSKLHEAVAAVVQKVEPQSGNALVAIDGTEVMLFKNDQIPGEELVAGQKIMVYVDDIASNEKRYTIKISRTHRELVKRLLEIHVPEIYDGTVEIKSISREAGSRNKVAVWSKDENVDAVGACIGPRGSRIANVVDEIAGEKIDVVNYSEDADIFVANALAPADVISVIVKSEEERTCTAIVPDDQLSLAIGNKGQNAKLAARLTGYKIDIRPLSQAGETSAPKKVAQDEAEQTDVLFSLD